MNAPPVSPYGGQQMARPLGSFKKGGSVKKSGIYHLEEGEHVLTKKQAKARFKTQSSSYNWREHRGGRSKEKESEEED